MKPNILTQYCTIYLVLSIWVFVSLSIGFLPFFLGSQCNDSIDSVYKSYVSDFSYCVYSTGVFVVGEMDPNEGLKQGTLLPTGSSSCFLEKENVI